MPGITGESRVLINESGIRGSSFSEADRHRILAIGGSTTACIYLDQTETWTYLLQENLNKELGESSVWVGNVGKSGHNTRHHALQIEKLLDRYPRIDVVVLLVGVNDMRLGMNWGPEFILLDDEDSDYHRDLVKQAFYVRPAWGSSNPLYELTEVARILEKIRLTFFSSEAQDRTGRVYEEWRNNRRNAARIRTDIPDLTIPLEDYRRNLNAIIDTAEKHNTRVVLMTQPSMYRADLPPGLIDLLWSGGVGNREYFSVEAMAYSLDRYNEVLLEVCEQRDFHCVDLASYLAKDDTNFYDDVHFNESGARTVANVIAQSMIAAEILPP